MTDLGISHATALGHDLAHEYAGFQLYTKTEALVASKLPSSLTFTQGSVLPLALSTASAGLYAPEQLALPFPSLSPQPSNKIVLIWGGSSSVGATAIQLATASGVTVISTASSHNISFVKSLGAAHVFEHSSSSVVDDILSTIEGSGKEFAGVFDAISVKESYAALSALYGKLKTGVRKIATTLPPSDLPEDVAAAWVFAVTVLTQHKQVGEAVWGKYVPEALEKGVLKALPEPVVIGKGLESVQKGLDANKKGVSAKKVVVEL